MSFTIKCDNCGKEQCLENGKNFEEGAIWLLSICSYGTKNINIECDCGNEIDEAERFSY
jgi:hypothetical protein